MSAASCRIQIKNGQAALSQAGQSPMIELVDVDMTLSESDVTEQKVDEWQLQLAPTKSFELTGDPSELILKSPVALDYNIGPSGTYVSLIFGSPFPAPTTSGGGILTLIPNGTRSGGLIST